MDLIYHDLGCCQNVAQLKYELVNNWAENSRFGE